MEFNQEIINFLITYRLVAIFIGAFFFGETVILAAAFLAGQGRLDLAAVFGLSFAATIISDSAWFLLGQKILAWFNRLDKYKAQSQKLIDKIAQYTGKKPFLSLLFIKFLYGIRVIAIIYLSIRKISFKTFVIYDSIGSFIWLSTIILIGWLAGKSIISLGPNLNKVEFAVGLFIILVLVVRMGTKWFSQKLLKN